MDKNMMDDQSNQDEYEPMDESTSEEERLSTLEDQMKRVMDKLGLSDEDTSSSSSDNAPSDNQGPHKRSMDMLMVKFGGKPEVK